MQEKKEKESRDERKGWAYRCECGEQDCSDCQKAFRINHFKPTNPGGRERTPPQRIEQEAVVGKKHPAKKAPKEDSKALTKKPAAKKAMTVVSWWCHRRRNSNRPCSVSARGH